MTIITVSQISKIVGGTISARQRPNIDSILFGLDAHGDDIGLNRFERIVHYISQVAHESGRFVYDKEVWDGKGAQARYDTRTDLGNTAAVDGDGKLFLGRSGIQMTGKKNYTLFYAWCQAQGFLNVPNFVTNPEAVLTDPWEGLVPIWYWSTNNLNKWADTNNYEALTKAINGGLNGYDDRLILLTRASLVMLNYDLKEGAIKSFQAANGLVADDIVGKETRNVMHKLLKAKSVSSASDAANLVRPEKPLPVLGNSEELQIAEGNTTDASTSSSEAAIRQFINHPSMLQYRN